MQAPVAPEPEPVVAPPVEWAPQMAAPLPEPPAAAPMSMLDAAMSALRAAEPVAAAAQPEPAPAPAAETPVAPAPALLDQTIRQPAPERPRTSSLLLDLGASPAAEPGGLLGADWRNAQPIAAPESARPALVFSLLDALTAAPSMSFAPRAAPPPPLPSAASGLFASLRPIPPAPAEAPAKAVAVAVKSLVSSTSTSLSVLPAAAVSLTLSEIFSRLAGRSDVEAPSPGDDMPAPAPLL